MDRLNLQKTNDFEKINHYFLHFISFTTWTLILVSICCNIDYVQKKDLEKSFAHLHKLTFAI